MPVWGRDFSLFHHVCTALGIPRACYPVGTVGCRHEADGGLSTKAKNISSIIPSNPFMIWYWEITGIFSLE
jgi:hypothetical protein